MRVFGFFPNLSLQLPLDLIHSIQSSFRRNPRIHADHLIWGLTGNGCFTIKSMYNFISSIGKIQDSHIGHSFKWIWHINEPPKLKTFLWLAQHNRLSTSSYLARLGLDINPICKACNNHIEDIIHIFFDCPITKDF